MRACLGHPWRSGPMPRWQKSYEPVSCRCCGATKAERGWSHSSFGICRTCETMIEKKLHKELTEQSVQDYLISRLKSVARKAEKGIPVTRCECIGVSGFQCGGAAKEQRLGKWICGSHARQQDHKLLFTAAPQVTPAALIAGIISKLPADMKKEIRQLL